MSRGQRLNLFLRLDDCYAFIMNSWRSERQGRSAIIFQFWLDRTLTPPGVNDIHATVTDDGSYHWTFGHACGRRIWVHRSHVTVRIPRAINDRGFYEAITLPPEEELSHSMFRIPTPVIPPFDEFKSTGFYSLGFGLALPIPPTPEDREFLSMRDSVGTECRVLDVRGMSGTLNFMPFLSATRTPELVLFGRGKFSEDVVCGDSPPYFGTFVSLHTSRAPTESDSP